MTQDTTQKFQLTRHWRAWQEWPAVMALATGLALWVFLVVQVVFPLADALVRLDPAVASARTEVLPIPPMDEALACGEAR